MALSQNLEDFSIKTDGYYTATRQEMFEFIPKTARKILDVGCGSGKFGEQLLQNGELEIWGIELDPEVASHAQKRLHKVLIGSASKMVLEVPDNYFDCVVFNDILEHLVDPFDLLNLIKSKLNENGIIVCSIPNIRYYPTLKALVVNKQWKYEDAGVLDKTHLRFFTKRSLIEMFEQLNYDLLEITGINPINSWKLKIINLITLGFFSDTKYVQFACRAKPRNT